MEEELEDLGFGEAVMSRLRLGSTGITGTGSKEEKVGLSGLSKLSKSQRRIESGSFSISSVSLVFFSVKQRLPWSSNGKRRQDTGQVCRLPWYKSVISLCVSLYVIYTASVLQPSVCN